ncbi:hypothetical protein BLNAU_6794 [Blattamonas nauphoetae]|uniref:non-specific serine/threonine protein kinase n=1 Tax=Blattamonas nauphoetae TaxID=2049346 RepID=A0ABQ9Y3I5_9EUKA|nr:hypothetical protein BLNAU_6794 [Blattamonas nauphoetae]
MTSKRPSHTSSSINRFTSLDSIITTYANGDPVLEEKIVTTLRQRGLIDQEKPPQRNKTPPCFGLLRGLLEFDLDDIIGQGGFGSVWRIKNKLTSFTYALKVMLLDSKTIENHPEMLTDVLKEVHILSQINHPNVVRFYSAWFDMYDERMPKDFKNHQGNYGLPLNFSTSTPRTSEMNVISPSSHFTKHVTISSPSPSPPPPFPISLPPPHFKPLQSQRDSPTITEPFIHIHSLRTPSPTASVFGLQGDNPASSVQTTLHFSQAGTRSPEEIADSFHTDSEPDTSIFQSSQPNVTDQTVHSMKIPLTIQPIIQFDPEHNIGDTDTLSSFPLIKPSTEMIKRSKTPPSVGSSSKELQLASFSKHPHTPLHTILQKGLIDESSQDSHQSIIPPPKPNATKDLFMSLMTVYNSMFFRIDPIEMRENPEVVQAERKVTFSPSVSTPLSSRTKQNISRDVKSPLTRRHSDSPSIRTPPSRLTSLDHPAKSNLSKPQTLPPSPTLTDSSLSSSSITRRTNPSPIDIESDTWSGYSTDSFDSSHTSDSFDSQSGDDSISAEKSQKSTGRHYTPVKQTKTRPLLNSAISKNSEHVSTATNVISFLNTASHGEIIETAVLAVTEFLQNQVHKHSGTPTRSKTHKTRSDSPSDFSSSNSPNGTKYPSNSTQPSKYQSPNLKRPQPRQLSDFDSADDMIDDFMPPMEIWSQDRTWIGYQQNDDNQLSIIFEQNLGDSHTPVPSESPAFKEENRRKRSNRTDRSLNSPDRTRQTPHNAHTPPNKQSAAPSFFPPFSTPTPVGDPLFSQYEQYITPVLCVQMELCNHKTLREWITDRPAFLPQLSSIDFISKQAVSGRSKEESVLFFLHSIRDHIARFLFIQILFGMNDLHSHRIIHNDLSPQNILLQINDESHELVAKIGDFGFSTLADGALRATAIKRRVRKRQNRQTRERKPNPSSTFRNYGFAVPMATSRQDDSEEDNNSVIIEDDVATMRKKHKNGDKKRKRTKSNQNETEMDSFETLDQQFFQFNPFYASPELKKVFRGVERKLGCERSNAKKNRQTRNKKTVSKDTDDSDFVSIETDDNGISSSSQQARRKEKSSHTPSGHGFFDTFVNSEMSGSDAGREQGTQQGETDEEVDLDSAPISSLTTASDVYSLGLILFELLHPFGTHMERANEIQSLVKTKTTSQAFKDLYPMESELISMMLDDNPHKRPSVYSILTAYVQHLKTFTTNASRHTEQPSPVSSLASMRTITSQIELRDGGSQSYHSGSPSSERDLHSIYADSPASDPFRQSSNYFGPVSNSTPFLRSQPLKQVGSSVHIEECDDEKVETIPHFSNGNFKHLSPLRPQPLYPDTTPTDSTTSSILEDSMIVSDLVSIKSSTELTEFLNLPPSDPVSHAKELSHVPSQYSIDLQFITSPQTPPHHPPADTYAPSPTPPAFPKGPSSSLEALRDEGTPNQTVPEATSAPPLFQPSQTVESPMTKPFKSAVLNNSDPIMHNLPIPHSFDMNAFTFFPNLKPQMSDSSIKVIPHSDLPQIHNQSSSNSLIQTSTSNKRISDGLVQYFLSLINPTDTTSSHFLSQYPSFRFSHAAFLFQQLFDLTKQSFRRVVQKVCGNDDSKDEGDDHEAKDEGTLTVEFSHFGQPFVLSEIPYSLVSDSRSLFFVFSRDAVIFSQRMFVYQMTHKALTNRLDPFSYSPLVPNTSFAHSGSISTSSRQKRTDFIRQTDEKDNYERDTLAAQERVRSLSRENEILKTRLAEERDARRAEGILAEEAILAILGRVVQKDSSTSEISQLLSGLSNNSLVSSLFPLFVSDN